MTLSNLLFGSNVRTVENTGASRRGFTLIELLVVVGMIAVILGALTTSVSSAQQRARIQRATSDVKVISQAILAYENYARGNKYELPTITSPQECNSGTLGFLLGRDAADSGGKIPTLLMAQLRGQGKIVDPWGTPYRLTIKSKSVSIATRVQLSTGFYLPNFYRLGWEERQ